MGNKPHRVKKMQQKALRNSASEDRAKNQNQEITQNIQNPDLKPFNIDNAKETLSLFKKDIAQAYLKHKPHHSKRTTTGDVEQQVPRIMNSKTFEDKNKKKWERAGLQKSADQARKNFKDTWKKAG